MGGAVLPALGSDLRRAELVVQTIARSRYWIGNLQADLAGMRAAGDWLSMMLPAQDVLLHGCDAILARFGRTNPTSKWRVRQLAAIDRQAAAAPACAFLELYRAPATTPAAILPFALRAAAFARASLFWAETSAGTPDAADLGVLLADHRRGELVLDLDITTVIRDDRLIFARLGDGAAVDLPATLAPAALWLDGRGGVSSTGSVAEDAPPHGAALLIDRLGAAGFLVPGPALESRLAWLLGAGADQNSPR